MTLTLRFIRLVEEEYDVVGGACPAKFGDSNVTSLRDGMDEELGVLVVLEPGLRDHQTRLRDKVLHPSLWILQLVFGKLRQVSRSGLFLFLLASGLGYFEPLLLRSVSVVVELFSLSRQRFDFGQLAPLTPFIFGIPGL